MVKVNKLYKTCKKTFDLNGQVPPPKAIKHLRSVLDTVRPSDVGLEEEARQSREQRPVLAQNDTSSNTPLSRPVITYLELFENEIFSMGIFCLPASAVIPLHNHPGMTVLSKVIYGSLHVRAYDWVEDLPSSNSSEPRAAKLVVDNVYTAPCQPFVLYPRSGGNIHSFTAETPCAVLDILAPPYSDHHDRNCTFFHQVSDPRGDTDAENIVWLEECQPSEDFLVPRGVYRGPPIIS